jgi:hypothetical protein
MLVFRSKVQESIGAWSRAAWCSRGLIGLAPSHWCRSGFQGGFTPGSKTLLGCRFLRIGCPESPGLGVAAAGQKQKRTGRQHPTMMKDKPAAGGYVHC